MVPGRVLSFFFFEDEPWKEDLWCSGRASMQLNLVLKILVAMNCESVVDFWCFE